MDCKQCNSYIYAYPYDGKFCSPFCAMKFYETRAKIYGILMFIFGIASIIILLGTR